MLPYQGCALISIVTISGLHLLLNQVVWPDAEVAFTLSHLP